LSLGICSQIWLLTIYQVQIVNASACIFGYRLKTKYIKIRQLLLLSFFFTSGDWKLPKSLHFQLFSVWFRLLAKFDFAIKRRLLSLIRTRKLSFLLPAVSKGWEFDLIRQKALPLPFVQECREEAYGVKLLAPILKLSFCRLKSAWKHLRCWLCLPRSRRSDPPRNEPKFAIPTFLGHMESAVETFPV
jgi:hypothetical protein